MITKATLLALLISADLSAALSVQAATSKSVSTAAAASILPLPSNVIRDAKEGISGDSAEVEGNKANKANKFSPQDNTVYDGAYKVDNEDKYHAPKVAPNDKQPDYDSDKQAEKKPVKDTTYESEKGKKGSVILDDYDPSRLGVSANEAKEKTSKDDKEKDTVDKNIDGAKGAKNTEIVKDTEGAQGAKGTKGTKSSASDAKDSKAPVKDSITSNTKSPTEDNKAVNAKEDTGKSEKAGKDTTKGTDKVPEKGAAKNAGTVDDDTTNNKNKALVNTHSTTSTATATATSTATATATAAAAAGTEHRDEAQFGRFIGSALMIVVSEIGDKTFFIAALMAMRHPPAFVFSSSYSAMVVMTILSMVLGLILPSLLSRKVTTLLAALLFVVFGIRMLTEAWGMDKSIAATDEMEEVENDLALHDSTKAIEKAEGGGLPPDDNPASKFHSREIKSVLSYVLSPVWIQIFVMTFLGEWGDRSQIATVAMGAGEGWLELLLGCLSGHFITTLIAVLGGKILAQHLSLRTITFSGAICFLLFGVFYFKDWLEEH